MTRKPHRIIILLVLVIAAIAVPTASARPIDEVGYNPQPSQPESSSSPAQSLTSAERTALVAVPSSPREVRVTTDSSDEGFSWSDAGIGAGAMLALSLVALGGGLFFTSHRHREPGAATTA